MARKMPFRIGAGASCSDGACGHVSRIIVNPVAREVTHLVVDQKHRNGPGRLVPVDLVDATTGQIRLRCTLAEFQALRPAQETEVVPDLDPSGPQESPSPHSVSFLPLSAGVFGMPGAGEVRPDRGAGRPEAPQEVTVQLRPIRRGRHTQRTDRLCSRWRDRAGPGTGRGTWRPLCNPRAPPGGAHVGPQGSGCPDRRCD